ncbi:hypothetical protein TWF225_001809 [Orbilia oligospora]|uniref:Protein kinase domain-containing protein n=1 Tax=Arthrobotrys oligospora (strain ATCC 24927 / CBS 115.81 / DSM 1491) TaxID=756982 RepID=G1X7R8_ARTOA|nr:hypothetical protein AOL_s00054g985 [Orbilia oligospora ATCC 24927]EGX50899.1 hypothetical protein AOL_s00054g985 [Orbilia oligospora ATCC 24927]KAF3190841.1 hypothetical protein TWF225_001809 [Orbilia oligospora]KAF3293744.1 hypothetical protein TWF132_004336 [Orbilia oligospora]
MANSVEEECCTGLSNGLRRQARSFWEAAFEFRNHKEIDFAYSKCDPHPFPHPESDRLEHCYKYGKGSGKFYPVLLEQKLGDFVVKAKLGHGNFASVWQCVLDEGKERDLPYESVAVKVCTNSKKDSKDDVTEAKVLMKLGKRSDGKGDFGKKHLQKVDECFRVPGYFGDHFCIVGEAIGPSLDYYLNLVQKQGLGHFDTEVSKKVTFQLLSSVTWLHKAGYGHGDIHPHNILMKEMGFKAGTNAKRPICIQNTKPEDVPYMPPYLVSCIDDDLTVRTPLTVENCDARLADFGQTFKKNHPRRLYKMTTPKGNRSPEWVLKHTPITIGIDIWSIACIAYRMTTGKHLMFVEERYKDDEGKYTQKRTRADINNDHMPMMAELLGTPPAWMIRKWNISGLPNMDWKSITPEGTLHERIMQDRPANMSNAQAALFEDFMRQALTWDYRYRATAAELIQHEWFESILSEKDRLHLSKLAQSTSRCSKTFTKVINEVKSWPGRIMSLCIKKKDYESQSDTEVKALGPILGARTWEEI